MNNTPQTSEEARPTSPHTEGGNVEGHKGGFFRVLILTFLIALSIRVFIAQPFLVNGQSMEPAFENGEYLIIDELSYRMRNPERGEIIVFRFPQDTSKFFIKRIIGLPEETVTLGPQGVTITTAEGTATTLEEAYINASRLDHQTVKLSPDEYFVMGDNRRASSDSRRWGPVSRDLIVGRALFRFLPITHAEILPGEPQ